MAQGGISTINDALAYRYALKELNAFAVRGLDYCNANKNGELDLLDPVTDNGTLSEAWLADRAAMLSWIVQSNTLDQNPVDATFSDGSVWHFSDLATGKSVAAGQGLFPPRHYVVFGGDRTDITGGEYADRFYGAGGNDVMYGYGGDDYLEGGKGDDKLIGGNDNDQIYGGIGGDTLEGGKGNDILYGGSGDDTYIYNIGDGKDWGVPAAKVRQLDWWQGIDVGGVRFVATPARHFSGRGLFDKNTTQWVSWVILAPEQRVFFSGDSGYFDGFRQIGEKYGPFDLTLLETGAYNENWPSVHMHPEESIQAHLDLKGKRLLPIHNGTFDLSMHSWQEPFDRIVALGNAAGIPVITPLMGEPVSMHATTGGRHWWNDPEKFKETERVQVKGQPSTVEKL